MWWLLVILVACAQVPQVHETVYSFEAYESRMPAKVTSTNASEPVVENKTPVAVVNETVNAAAKPVVETPVPIEQLEVIEDLTIAQQHKMIVQLEEDAKKSECYQLTWIGFENESKELPLSIDRQLRFEYLGARLFKGWILNRLLVQKEQVASETVELLWDTGNITCIDYANFSTDWEKIHRRFDWTH